MMVLEVHSLEAASRNKGVPCGHCTEKELVSYLANTAHTFFLTDEADIGTGHWRGHKCFQVLFPRNRAHTPGTLEDCPLSDWTCVAHTGGSTDLLLLLCKDMVPLICHATESHLLSRSSHSCKAKGGRNLSVVDWRSPPHTDCTVSLQRWTYRYTVLSRHHRWSQPGSQSCYSHRPYKCCWPTRKGFLCKCHTSTLWILFFFFCMHTAQEVDRRAGSLGHGGYSGRAHIHHPQYSGEI